MRSLSPHTHSGNWELETLISSTAVIISLCISNQNVYTLNVYPCY